MSRLLASVCTVEEAQLALRAGADIIDCKNPQQGALGALPLPLLQLIVQSVRQVRPISATVGDIADPTQLETAVGQVGTCGVDYIKFGLFDSESASDCLAAIRSRTKDHRLIAVCFADRFDPLPLLPLMADSGLSGVMLDTADKSAGRLTELWSAQRRQTFVEAAQQQGLLCGLAGRLTVADIPLLLPHQADYLGFRSALCGGNRRESLQWPAAQQVYLAINEATHARQTRMA